MNRNTRKKKKISSTEDDMMLQPNNSADTESAGSQVDEMNIDRSNLTMAQIYERLIKLEEQNRQMKDENDTLKQKMNKIEHDTSMDKR